MRTITIFPVILFRVLPTENDVETVVGLRREKVGE